MKLQKCKKHDKISITKFLKIKNKLYIASEYSPSIPNEKFWVHTWAPQPVWIW